METAIDAFYLTDDLLINLFALSIDFFNKRLLTQTKSYRQINISKDHFFFKELWNSSFLFSDLVSGTGL